MKIGKHDLNKDILVVAEIGNNHEGSYALAEELIGKAVETGVGAVKFQAFRTEKYVNYKERERFQKLKKFELTYEEFEKLGKYAHNAGILFLSSAFDLESARFMGHIVDALKIASADNTFYPLISEMAKTGKPLIISSGLVNLDQLNQALYLIKTTWMEDGINQHLAVLHCVSSYPVALEQANLKAITELKRTLKCTVGYSDHTMGIEAAVVAAAMGAQIIEKHFTIDTNYSDFRDHSLSADPESMAKLVERINQVRSMLGDGAIALADCEKEDAKTLRRSIAAGRDLAAGTILKWEDITWIRPGYGIPPGKENEVLGRQLKRNLVQGDIITHDFLE